MAAESLLIANRGEIAIRIARAAAELGLRSVAVHSDDDASALHVRLADEARALPRSGPAAYLDGAQLVAVARAAGCTLVHPGYGFLSERADFARQVADAGLVFVGPRPDVLERFGDKVRARAVAAKLGVPVLPGTTGATTRADAAAFLASHGPVMLKAVAGGGGRGMRVVRDAAALDDAWARCASEARAAFGDDALYLERLVPRARHVEVQVVGDRSGAVVALGDRDCTLQRRHQKLVEIAPAPNLPPVLRAELERHALRLAADARVDGLATFEFLVELADDGTPGAAFFVEANPRLQVEHTVTEEVFGVDLVATQVRLAQGATLRDLGLAAAPAPRGVAVQVRVNTETLDASGALRPASGTLVAYAPPSGPGVRVDGCGYAGWTTSPRFDPLLAKVIAHAPHAADAFRRARRALEEFAVDGVATNVPLLRALVAHPDVQAARVATTFVETHAAALAASAAEATPRRFAAPLATPAPAASTTPVASATPRSTTTPVATATPRSTTARAGAQIDASDPLAVLVHGKQAPAAPAAPAVDVPAGAVAVRAPLQGTVVSLDVRDGDRVPRGHALLVMEAMKMEHVVVAPAAGVVRGIAVAVGDAVVEGALLVVLEEAAGGDEAGATEAAVDPDHVRPDLAEALARHAVGLDAARPDAVARRRKTGQRTARENVADLCDPGTFVEYGPLVLAAQRRRRSVEELIAKTPADGLVGGLGLVNGALFDEARARCVCLSYDYTVLAGTQGAQNHRKKDRLFELAEQWRLPVVLFAEGGGGRPGDTDGLGVAGLDCLAFQLFGGLSGLVPLVGIVSGRCFAGNAALLGCCDVVIATRNANVGMGGPAMIEGGGLGIYRPGEVGPIDVQAANGVVDVAVADEAEAVAVAKRYLSYFQGPLREWTAPDQRRLRHLIPENRLRVYDVRAVVDGLADTGSVLELRRGFGAGMITALIRVEGRPLGLVANDPMHLAGAITSDGADKAARFLQLCDAFDLPVLFLCDTPGIMVGPEAEKTALVRHAARLFVVGASLRVPFCTIVLRKGYGLGAQAMAGGSFKAPMFTVAWPTGEFGGMGLEGAVKLAFRNELAAIADPAARRAAFDEMVARMYEHGKAVSMASHFEIDDVIDPADSRRWIVGALRSVPPPAPRTGKKRPCVDTW